MNTEWGWAQKTVIVSALVWLGMLLGISFLATPAKFLAQSLSLPVALDVGRQTFGIFSIVEAVASLILLTAAVLSGHQKRNTVLAALIGCFVAVQLLWLLPALDARVEIILQGATPPASSLHNIYIAVDIVKLLLLGSIAWSMLAASPENKRSVATNAQ